MSYSWYELCRSTQLPAGWCYVATSWDSCCETNFALKQERGKKVSRIVVREMLQRYFIGLNQTSFEPIKLCTPLKWVACRVWADARARPGRCEGARKVCWQILQGALSAKKMFTIHSAEAKLGSKFKIRRIPSLSMLRYLKDPDLKVVCLFCTS